MNAYRSFTTKRLQHLDARRDAMHLTRIVFENRLRADLFALRVVVCLWVLAIAAVLWLKAAG